MVNASLTSATASSGSLGLSLVRQALGIPGRLPRLLICKLMEYHGLEDVDNDGNLDDDNSVSGQVQFGIYRGSDRVIWWNEQD